MPQQDRLARILVTPALNSLFGRAGPSHISRIKPVSKDDNISCTEVTAEPAPVAQASSSSSIHPPKKPLPKKLSKHTPGAADTAWNLFGRAHIKLKGNSKLTHAHVKQAWDALDETGRSKYENEAAELKRAEKNK
ncbi:hypothetical protein B0H13DRAFT_1898824 [Mycena leptocephala]|nr:hypothetical protein B0H13DRAFT_1898824 [Mycena leptocephala]